MGEKDDKEKMRKKNRLEKYENEWKRVNKEEPVLQAYVICTTCAHSKNVAS